MLKYMTDYFKSTLIRFMISYKAVAEHMCSLTLNDLNIIYEPVLGERVNEVASSDTNLWSTVM